MASVPVFLGGLVSLLVGAFLLWAMMPERRETKLPAFMSREGAQTSIVLLMMMLIGFGLSAMIKGF